MSDSLEIELKNEIDDISDRIDTIIKKIDELAPKAKEEEPLDEQPPEEPTEIDREDEMPS